ncbi:hypothetical protein [Erwinia sp. JUb26]|uniref:hypothetical protein n=1 Tax=Erwinia sp. JUb26 TaxID=2485126 RepID=UPI000F494DE8|nr:hypothetical protein [Erwinia sp. JUb26]
MMLKGIGFDGFNTKSASYEINDISERGSFNVFFSDPDVTISKETDVQYQQILMKFEVSMLGYAEGVDPEKEDSEVAFEAQFTIETYFTDHNENPMNENDIQENMWFFENFNQISTRIAADSTFKNSDINHIPIPWTAKSALLAE